MASQHFLEQEVPRLGNSGLVLCSLLDNRSVLLRKLHQTNFSHIGFYSYQARQNDLVVLLLGLFDGRFFSLPQYKKGIAEFAFHPLVREVIFYPCRKRYRDEFSIQVARSNWLPLLVGEQKKIALQILSRLFAQMEEGIPLPYEGEKIVNSLVQTVSLNPIPYNQSILFKAPVYFASRGQSLPPPEQIDTAGPVWEALNEMFCTHEEFRSHLLRRLDREFDLGALVAQIWNWNYIPSRFRDPFLSRLKEEFASFPPLVDNQAEEEVLRHKYQNQARFLHRHITTFYQQLSQLLQAAQQGERVLDFSPLLETHAVFQQLLNLTPWTGPRSSFSCTVVLDSQVEAKKKIGWTKRREETGGEQGREEQPGKGRDETEGEQGREERPGKGRDETEGEQGREKQPGKEEENPARIFSPSCTQFNNLSSSELATLLQYSLKLSTKDARYQELCSRLHQEILRRRTISPPDSDHSG